MLGQMCSPPSMYWQAHRRLISHLISLKWCSYLHLGFNELESTGASVPEILSVTPGVLNDKNHDCKGRSRPATELSLFPVSHVQNNHLEC